MIEDDDMNDLLRKTEDNISLLDAQRTRSKTYANARDGFRNFNSRSALYTCYLYAYLYILYYTYDICYISRPMRMRATVFVTSTTLLL